jgi:hypothetical protein
MNAINEFYGSSSYRYNEERRMRRDREERDRLAKEKAKKEEEENKEKIREFSSIFYDETITY